MIVRKSLALLLSMAAMLWQLPVLACGPFFDDPDYSFTLHPDMPLRKFAAGNIGVLKSTMARSYLVLAWRYLNGIPLSTVEQESILALWEQRLANGNQDYDRPVKSWTDIRKKLGVTGDRAIYPERIFNGKEANFSYINCPSSAFTYALKIAQQVSSQFGAGSEELKSWANAQDSVFCNCNGSIHSRPTIPSQLDATLNVKLKPYRDYQIASANFYAGNYDLAVQEFEKISEDADSPFRDLGSYLALRATVRKAVVAEKTDDSLLALAEKQVKVLLNDKSKTSIHSGLEDLLGYIRFKIDKQARFAELTKSLSEDAEASNAGNNLCDYTFLFDDLLGESSDEPSIVSKVVTKAQADGLMFIQQSGDLSDWILTFQGRGTDASQHAISKWRLTHKLAWLVAALTLVDSKDPECSKLIDDAKKISKNMPAYQHLQYTVAVQLAALNKREDARKAIEIFIADKTNDFGPSTLNMFVEERLVLSKDFSDFLHFALQRPASIDSGWSANEMPIDYDEMRKAKSYKIYEASFSSSTCKFFNSAVPLSLLSILPGNLILPARLRSDVLQSLWVRAFLLDDTKTLAAVSPRLKQANSAFAPLITAYEKSAGAEEKSFTGAFMILRNPGMRPVITSGYGRRTPINRIDDYQDNWWQQADLAVPAKTADGLAQSDNDALKFANCLNQKQKSDAASENKTILSLGLAPAILCKDVLVFARKSPQDPRVPEALSLAVRATHFGEHNSSTTKLSKECFTLLHDKYKNNPWTAKTKYYY